jgi:hypothetical protein
LHPLDLPGVRDKYYAQYEKRPKKYAGETTVTGEKNPRGKKATQPDGPYVLASLQPSGELIGYLSSTGSGRRAIHATRHAAITFVTRKAAEVYNEENERGRLTPIHVADLHDPDGPTPRYSVTGKKNPVARRIVAKRKNPEQAYLIRAHHENGTVYFLTNASKLSTEKKDAERFTYANVERTQNWLEDRLPKTIKFVDAVQA